MPKLNEILGEADFAQIPEDVKKKYADVDLVDITKYVSQDNYNQVKKERDDYKKTVGERDKQIKDLEPLAKDNENLKTKLTDLQTKNKEDLDKQEAEYKKQMFNIALDAKLTTVGARNPKVLKGLLDLDKLTLEDNGNFIGLKEQVEAIKKSDAYLFGEDNVKVNPEENLNPGGTGNIGNPGSQQLGKELSLGERLAKQKTEAMKATEAQNKFFSIGGTNK